MISKLDLGSVCAASSLPLMKHDYANSVSASSAATPVAPEQGYKNEFTPS